MGMVLPPFRLYGLMGCPHCAQAEQFFITENIPVIIVVGNDDPIVEAGVRWAMQQKNPNLDSNTPAAYPMLVCTFGRQIVEGFKEDEYRKLADAYRILFNSTPSTGAPDPVSSGQLASSEDPSASTPMDPVTN